MSFIRLRFIDRGRVSRDRETFRPDGATPELIDHFEVLADAVAQLDVSVVWEWLSAPVVGNDQPVVGRSSLELYPGGSLDLFLLVHSSEPF